MDIFCDNNSNNQYYIIPKTVLDMLHERLS